MTNDVDAKRRALDHAAGITVEAQAGRYSAAIRKAINAISDDVEANQGHPFMNAAIGALAVAIAELIATVPDRNVRRSLIRETEKVIGQEITKRLNNGLPPAVIVPDRRGMN